MALTDNIPYIPVDSVHIVPRSPWSINSFFEDDKDRYSLYLHNYQSYIAQFAENIGGQSRDNIMSVLDVYLRSCGSFFTPDVVFSDLFVLSPLSYSRFSSKRKYSMSSNPVTKISLDILAGGGYEEVFLPDYKFLYVTLFNQYADACTFRDYLNIFSVQPPACNIPYFSDNNHLEDINTAVTVTLKDELPKRYSLKNNKFSICGDILSDVFPISLLCEGFVSFDQHILSSESVEISGDLDINLTGYEYLYIGTFENRLLLFPFNGSLLDSNPYTKNIYKVYKRSLKSHDPLLFANKKYIKTFARFTASIFNRVKDRLLFDYCIFQYSLE